MTTSTDASGNTELTTQTGAQVIVWVPAVHTTIDSGAGIVSSRPERGGRVTVDFEGNRHGAGNIVTFADRVYHAYGRQVTDYPTIARMSLQTSWLIRVATFDPKTGIVYVGSAAAAATLAGWLGVQTIPEEELLCSDYKHTMARQLPSMLASPDPALRAQADWYARRYGR